MIVLLLFIFITLQFADCFTTIYILGNGGKEVNPILAKLFNVVGVWQTLVIMKFIAIAVVATFAKLAPDITSFWVLGIADIMYLCVVSWNSYQIWKD